VLYRSGDGQLLRARVLARDDGLQPPSYLVRLAESGSERHTEESRLAAAPPEPAQRRVQDEAASSSGRTGAAAAAATTRAAAQGLALAAALRQSRAVARDEAHEQRVTFPGTHLRDVSIHFGPSCPCAALYAAVRVELLQAALGGGDDGDAGLRALAEACCTPRGLKLRAPMPGAVGLPDGEETLSEVGCTGRNRLLVVCA